jgi:hypothetical protein
LLATTPAIPNCRQTSGNPTRSLGRRLVEIGLRELKAAESETLVTSIIAVVAIAKGQRTLGRFAIEFTEDERREMLAKAGWL